MRKTLNNLIEDATLDYEIQDAPVAGAPGERTEYHVVDAETIIDKCRAALAKPPRNCDVGTAEEQKFRQSKYCKKSSMGKGCSQCPLKDTLDCRFAWMQMPYAEEGAGHV